ncbi:MAG: hypothetical protein ACI867_000977 [Glaciecola sp.]
MTRLTGRRLHLARAVAPLVLVATIASACGAGQTTAPDGAIAEGEICGALQRPPLQSGSHLIGDTEPPVPYSSNPPSSGWHTSGAIELGVVPSPLTGPQVVSALEAGNVVVAYDPDLVDAQDLARLQELAMTSLDGRITVTAWAPMRSTIALVGWGALQRCNSLDETVVAAFALSFFGEAQRHG